MKGALLACALLVLVASISSVPVPLGTFAYIHQVPDKDDADLEETTSRHSKPYDYNLTSRFHDDKGTARGELEDYIVKAHNLVGKAVWRNIPKEPSD